MNYSPGCMGLTVLCLCKTVTEQFWRKKIFFAYFQDCRVNPLTKRISLVIQMEPGEIANYNTAQIGIPKVTLSLLVTFFSY